jgi:flavorubredoxin
MEVGMGPRIVFPEPSYPGIKDMGSRVLVAYASKAGSTAEIADAIARRMADAGLHVDVRRAKNARWMATPR